MPDADIPSSKLTLDIEFFLQLFFKPDLAKQYFEALANSCESSIASESSNNASGGGGTAPTFRLIPAILACRAVLPLLAPLSTAHLHFVDGHMQRLIEEPGMPAEMRQAIALYVELAKATAGQEKLVQDLSEKRWKALERDVGAVSEMFEGGTAVNANVGLMKVTTDAEGVMQTGGNQMEDGQAPEASGSKRLTADARHSVAIEKDTRKRSLEESLEDRTVPKKTKTAIVQVPSGPRV